jgi:hypothetical protein
MPEMVAPFRGVLQADIRRQLDRDLLRAARLVDAAAHPGDVRWLDAVVILEDAARPDVGRQLVLGEADAFALQVGGRLDAVAADVDRGVPERPRYERWHADVGAGALRRLHRMARQRQLADVELGVAEGAEEDLLRRQRHVDWIDPVDLDGAVDQGPGAVIVANGHGKIEFGHAGCLSGLKLASTLAIG